MTSVVTLPAAFVKYAETLRSDAARGRFYHELCVYCLTGKEPDFTGALAVWFETVRSSAQFYHENGTRFFTINGGKRAPKPEEKTPFDDFPPSSPPPATPLLNNETKGTHDADAGGSAGADDTPPPETDGNETDKEKKGKKESKEKKAEETFPVSPLIPEHLRTPAFLAKWEEWELFRRRKRKPVSLTAAKLQLKRLGAFSEEVARAMIDQSMANDWQGIFPLRRGSGPAAEPPRDYTGI